MTLVFSDSEGTDLCEDHTILDDCMDIVDPYLDDIYAELDNLTKSAKAFSPPPLQSCDLPNAHDQQSGGVFKEGT